MTKIADQTLQALIEAAIDARGRSYSPYSGHAVGAALLANDGEIYAGCNVENAAYPLGFCAEANAIGSMVKGGGTSIRHVVVLGPGDRMCTPCGGCRQQLNEFRGEGDVPVTLCDGNGSILMETTLDALLPHAFGPHNVKTAKGE